VNDLNIRGYNSKVFESVVSITIETLSNPNISLPISLEMLEVYNINSADTRYGIVDIYPGIDIDVVKDTRYITGSNQMMLKYPLSIERSIIQDLISRPADTGDATEYKASILCSMDTLFKNGIGYFLIAEYHTALDIIEERI
jgi:hypothetical protein